MTILLKAFVSFAVRGRRFWAPLLLLPLISSAQAPPFSFRVSIIRLSLVPLRGRARWSLPAFFTTP